MQELILAGGSGTRFWPLSRRSRPKQLLPLEGESSMLRLTVDRLAADTRRNHLWNAGIFLFRGTALLRHLEHFEPELESRRRTDLL